MRKTIKKYQDGGTTDERFGNRTKDYLAKLKPSKGFSKSRTVERNPEGTHKMITKSKSNARGESSSMKEKRTLRGILKGAPKTTNGGRGPANFDIPPVGKSTPVAKNGKDMIKRADGSYSRRGLWDNIRANRGSGKKPTSAMLKQERKIKAKSKK